MTKNELLQDINSPLADKTVFILRGIPGSGKSTLATEITSKTKDDSLNMQCRSVLVSRRW
jgi:ABC-type multidrug transport system ATPase subunit